MQILADCYASTTLNQATAPEFFSRMSCLESLRMLESEHYLVTALSVESWPRGLQLIQKHIKGEKVGFGIKNGITCESANECQKPGEIVHDKLLRAPLPVTHVDGESD